MNSYSENKQLMQIGACFQCVRDYSSYLLVLELLGGETHQDQSCRQIAEVFGVKTDTKRFSTSLINIKCSKQSVKMSEDILTVWAMNLRFAVRLDCLCKSVGTVH